jgi:hypothetical protein
MTDQPARRFQMQRDEDVTGVSGTGVVADGVQFPSGSVVIQWRGKHSSIVMWPDLSHVEVIHGHDGRTRIVWLDAA